MKKIIILLSFFLFSCGGSNGGSGTTTPPANNNPTTGIYGTGSTINSLLLDAPIKNMSYTSDSYSGTTNSLGQFTCKDGENVTFRLNGVSMGTTICKSVISPIELLTAGDKTIEDGLSSLNSTELGKLDKFLRVIQSLDEDNDLTDGVDVNVNLFVSWAQAGITNFSDFYNSSDTAFADYVDDIVEYWYN